MTAILKRVHLFAQSIGAIDFDVLVSEQHEQAVTLTEFPVESGAPMTDHSYRNNSQLTLTVAHSLAPFVRGSSGAKDDRLIDFHEKLKTAAANTELFEIGTGIELYENMAIVGLSTTRDGNTTTITQVVVSLREIRLVGVGDITDFRNRYGAAGGVNTRASPLTNRGPVQPEPISNASEQADVNRSLGKQLSNGILDYLGVGQ